MKHWSEVLPLALLSMFLASCSPPAFKGEIGKLIWETSGGGQIKFTVAPDDGGGYKVHLESYGFKEQHVDLVLTSSDGAAYEIVEAIFTKQRNIHDDTFTPGGPTGSWTSITLVGVDGNEEEIENISTGGDLGKIYDFAASGAKDEPEATPEAEVEEPPVPTVDPAE